MRRILEAGGERAGDSLGEELVCEMRALRLTHGHGCSHECRSGGKNPIDLDF